MSPSVIKAPRLCASPSAITKMSGVDGTNRMGVGGGWWRLGWRRPFIQQQQHRPCRVNTPPFLHFYQ